MEKFALDKDFNVLLKQYALNPAYERLEKNQNNSYKRRLSFKEIGDVDFNVPITREEVSSNKSIVINKLLHTIYEQDLLFLGNSLKHEDFHEDFNNFYDPEYVALGKYLQPTLERLAFDFLYDEVKPASKSDKHTLQEHFSNTMSSYEMEKNALCSAIEALPNAKLGIKEMLIQMAPDFLSEASPLARTLLGSFGQEQSEIMKIFIDEYGYGVHQEKHSTLFEQTLLSCNLSSEMHSYYDNYLPTSFMVINYFHFLCSNKLNWFKYTGALYYTEASIPHFDRQVSQLLNNNFNSVNSNYFDEHVHIDTHHCRMVLDKIIIPSIEKYGDQIINDIMFGFDSARLILDISDSEVIKKVNNYQ